MSKDNGGPASDRELLEMAAKAAGITIKPVEIKNVEFAGDDRFIGYSTDPHEWLRGWFNPLTDDGDALRLAVKLDLHVLRFGNMTTAKVCTSLHAFDERDNGDPLAATRRAILRCAAEIGKAIRTEGGAA